MESRLFTELSGDEIKKILSYMEIRHYDPMSFIFKEGEEGNEMYLIEKGEVEVFIERKEKRIPLAKLTHGDFFGEMGILRNNTRSASIQALDNVSLFILTRSDIAAITERSGDLAAKFLLNLSEVLAERIASTNKEVENWFLINDALVENEQFRHLYFKTHKK
jgi:CRP-like cAMP-binding protein